MPELPEIEVLARHLRPLLYGRTIRDVSVQRAKVLSPVSPQEFRRTLVGAAFTGLLRRGKYLLFHLRHPSGGKPLVILGHLGMTGRMYLAKKREQLPKHAAVVLSLDAKNFVYEDPRCFGRMTLDAKVIERLGPEPLSDEFQSGKFAEALKCSRQAVKVKLLDQKLVAGMGNIYASEALFRARLSPALAANRLTPLQVKRLQRAIRDVLTQAIKWGSTVPLNFGAGQSEGVFYFGRSADAPDDDAERLRVYGRAGKSCLRCRHPIRRITQAARSTFYCPQCQKARE